MNLTSRIRTIEIGLAALDTRPKLAELALEFVHLWSNDRDLAMRGEDMYYRWISRLTAVVAQVLHLAAFECDRDATASVLISATQRGGVPSIEALLDVPEREFTVPRHRSPRRHLEMAAAALSVLEDFVLCTLEQLADAALNPLTRDYTSVTVAGLRDAPVEDVYDQGDDVWVWDPFGDEG